MDFWFFLLQMGLDGTGKGKFSVQDFRLWPKKISTISKRAQRCEREASAPISVPAGAAGAAAAERLLTPASPVEQLCSPEPTSDCVGQLPGVTVKLHECQTVVPGKDDACGRLRLSAYALYQFLNSK